MSKQEKKATATRRVKPAISSARPKLTTKEIAKLTSIFDPKKWDATADADRAAEDAAKAPRKRVAYA